MSDGEGSWFRMDGLRENVSWFAVLAVDERFGLGVAVGGNEAPTVKGELRGRGRLMLVYIAR